MPTIFLRIYGQRQAVLMVGLQIEQHLLRQMVFIRRFLTGDLRLAQFSRSEVFRHGATRPAGSIGEHRNSGAGW